jgi:peptide/nickel transport system substrate-binding protein
MQRSILRSGIAIAVALSVSTGLAACASAEPDEPTSLGVGIEPALFRGQYTPQYGVGVDGTAVYESLLLFDLDKADFEPLLAESFELSDDRRTATFVVRDDVDFSDGVHMDAEGVAAVLTALIEKGIEDSTWGWTDFDVKFRATGEYELELTTAIPMAARAGHAFTGFVGLPIFSPAYVDDIEAMTDAPVGTGPYVLDEVVPEVSASFTRNENYWNPEAAPFATLEIRVFADPIAGLNALKSGQIDAVRIDGAVVGDAEANGLRINEGRGTTVGLWVGDRGGQVEPALADIRVRQAIELAFDREAINESLNHGRGVVTSQPFAEETPEYVEGGDDRYGYDPERARSLMAEAGYEDGFDLTIPGTTFLGINTWEPVVTQYLGDIGIRVTFESYADTGAWFTAALSGDYPVLLFATGSLIAMEVFVLPTAPFAFHDTFSDPTLDALTQTMIDGTLEESVEAASDIGEYVLDQAWYTAFASPNQIWATSPHIQIVDGVGEDPGIPQFQLAR